MLSRTPRSLPAKGLLLAAGLALLLLQGCVRSSSVAAEPSGQGTTISVEGRPFNLYTPPGLEGRQAPVVLVLHGGLSSAERVQGVLPLYDEAARSGFRLAYLDGTLEGRERANRRTWNAGDCCSEARDRGINDVGYISSVISTLVAQGLTSPGQVYLLGHSNGAMMSYRFACTRPDLVAGVMGLAGVFVMSSCPNSAGVRILHVHGLEDRLVPIGGGGGGDRLAGAPFRSVQQTTDALRAGGARVDVLFVPGADHPVESIDSAMRSALGLSIAARLGQFVRGQ
jgi:polyhydroxybutyrate depolymerase